MMRRPKVLLDPTDGLVHYVYFLDAVYWRPPCSLAPRTKPRGWKKQADDAAVTCISCLGDTGQRV